jgi:hypothetical protein
MKQIHCVGQRIVGYILIGIYAFALLRPVMPVVNDAIAHIFFEMEHLATVHYENGKYHIHLELEQLAEDTNIPNETQQTLSFDSLFYHLKTESVKMLFTYETPLFRRAAFVVDLPTDIYYTPSCPPPQV